MEHHLEVIRSSFKEKKRWRSLQSLLSRETLIGRACDPEVVEEDGELARHRDDGALVEIGRASCRERV